MSRSLRIVVLLVAVLAFLSVPQPARAAAPAVGARWSWPVAGAHPVIRPFVAPATAYAAGHRGIDIAAKGDVLAPADGIVHFVGFVVDRPVLSISHAGGVISSYEPVVSSLHVGDTVTRGEVIGQVLAGHCADSCLHFGVRIDGQYVSPMLFLGGIPYSVLLPTRTRRLTLGRPPATHHRHATRATSSGRVSRGMHHRDSPRSGHRDSP